MIRRRSRNRALVAAIFVLALLRAAYGEAAAPLQKVVFVFAGFDKRTGFIFVAKDREFLEEQMLQRGHPFLLHTREVDFIPCSEIFLDTLETFRNQKRPS